MVRRHFLFLSSVTPTRKVECGPGYDSPAELFKWPCGTPKAGSVLLSFCIWVCPERSMVGEEPCRCKDCLALEKMSFALDTLLLLRFFSAVEAFSSGLGFLSAKGLRVRSAVSSLCCVVGMGSGGMVEGVAVLESRVSSVRLTVGEAPNMRLRSPPL